MKSRKTALDLAAIHGARRKLQIFKSTVKDVMKDVMKDEDDPFIEAFHKDLSMPTPKECEVLLELIKRAENVLYPSFQEMSIHDYHLSLLPKIDSIHEAEQFNEIFEKVEEYEQKYCK